jgi:hypothetical protein
LQVKHPVKELEHVAHELPLIKYPGRHIEHAALVHWLQYENKFVHFLQTFELLYYPDWHWIGQVLVYIKIFPELSPVIMVCSSELIFTLKIVSSKFVNIANLLYEESTI